MSDDTDKEQRDAERKAGDELKKARKKIDGWSPTNFSNPLPDDTAPTSEAAKKAQKALDDFKKKLKKKLHKLKQLINDRKYDEADDLIDDFLDEFHKGWTANDKAHEPNDLPGNPRAVPPIPPDTTRKDIEKIMEDLADIKDVELWNSRD